jgi:hypothetical protein
MKRKRLLTPVALAIGLLAGTGSAVAAPQGPQETVSQQFDCPGFTVDAQSTGKFKDIESPSQSSPDSRPTKLLTLVGAASTVTLTGPAPASKVVHFSQNGTIRVAIASNNFDLIFTATGRNLIIVPAHPGYPGGLFLTVGKVGWTLDGPVYPNGGLTGPGSVTDVCQLLAP